MIKRKKIKIKDLFSILNFNEEEQTWEAPKSLKVLSENGFEKVEALYKTNKRNIITIKTKNHTLSGVSEHRVMSDNWIYLKDINIGDEVKTLNGYEKVIDVIENEEKQNCYDLQVENTHSFYTNDILSHNTEIINAWCKLTNKKVIIAFKNIKLAREIVARMKKAKIDVGLVQGKNVDENHQVVACTVQSQSKLNRIDYEAVLIDECFIGRTMIHTENGLKKISKLCSTKSTEKVYSFNPNTNEFELKPISNWYVKKADKLNIIEFNGKSRVHCTPNHPFYLEGYKRVKAEELQIGDKVIVNFNPKSEAYSVSEIKNIKEKTIKPQNVYNITVDDHHNYLVGAGYLVGNCHNASQNRYQDFLKRWDFEYRFGFSATPFNKNNKFKSWRVKAWLGDIIYNQPAKELIDQGHLAKPIITFLKVDKVINNVKRQKTEKLYDKQGNPIDQPEFTRAKRWWFDDEVEDDNGRIIKRTRYWYEQVEKELDPAAQWASAERQGIVHNVYRNKMIKTLANNLKGTVLALVKYVDSHGAKLHKEMEDALFLSGQDKIAEREQAVEMLEKNEIKTIIASTIFDEGVSINNIYNVIMCGGGRSYEKTLQRIGRGMRLHTDEEGNEKKVVRVYDFYDTTHPTLERHAKERIKYAEAEGYEVRIKEI